MSRPIRFQVHNINSNGDLDVHINNNNIQGIIDNIINNNIHIISDHNTIVMTSEMVNAILNSDSNPEQELNINVPIQKYSTLSDNVKKNYTECSICYEKYDENSNISILSCKHCFHTDCIKNWGKRKNNCPICREIIPIIEEE
jgi:hypothetical protein